MGVRMQINRLDHVNLRTAQLDTMTHWYGEVLGLRPGPRPDFDIPGVWLYAGDAAVVHLVEVEKADGAGSEQPLKLEHFAFTAAGGQDFEALLTRRGERFRKSGVPGTGTAVFNIWDPDGNHIHVDFDPDG